MYVSENFSIAVHCLFFKFFAEIKDGKEEAKDIRIWSENCINVVAKEIQTRIKNLRPGVSSMSKPALRRIVSYRHYVLRYCIDVGNLLEGVKVLFLCPISFS